MKQLSKKRYLAGGLCMLFILAGTGFLTASHTTTASGLEHHSPASGKKITEKPALKIAAGDTVVIRSEGADLSYDVTEIEATAGEELTIKYVNASDMPHNIVLVKTEADIMPVGTAALRAMDTDYVPQNEMDRIITSTELVRPGETFVHTFTVPPPGTYPYVCTYPGHFTLMQGRLISEE